MRIIRQVLLMMKEEKLFSAIHIAGTAMAIAFTMVMAVVYYIKLAPIYPEVNRMRTVYFNGIEIKADMKSCLTYFGYMAYEEWFRNSPNIEYCSPTELACGRGKNDDGCQKTIVLGKDNYIEAIVNKNSTDFFKIYDYKFISGRPFTKQEEEYAEKVCVITDAFAEMMFGKNAKPLGKVVEIVDGPKLRVVGVVRCTSQLTPDSYADIFYPYTAPDHFASYTGCTCIVATVKDTKHLKALKKELDGIAKKIEMNHEQILAHNEYINDSVKGKVSLTEHMEIHPIHVLRTEKEKSVMSESTNWQIIKHFAGILFILLFVPALNLCGIVAGRMERRTAEMAIRKTFGARSRTLLNQVIAENLVLTSIGGIIGLTVSWSAIYGMRTEILGMFFDYHTLGSAPIVTGEMLFAPLLFVGAFAAVLVLNLLSALIPAWLSLRKPIVESMMEKR